MIDSDGLLGLRRIPRSLVVVGAGVIGIEYASMLAALGAKVTVVEQRPTILDFCDEEIVEGLRHNLRDHGVVFRFGETVTRVERHEGGTVTELDSGKRIAADAVFYSAGRQGDTASLGLEAVGLEADARGRIAVDAHYRTAVPHLRRGRRDRLPEPGRDVDGARPPRRAARVRRARPGDHRAAAVRHLHDPGDQLRRQDGGGAHRRGRPVRDRRLRYRELARGQILGDSYGLLKLLVGTADRRVLGVHVLGTGRPSSCTSARR